MSQPQRTVLHLIYVVTRPLLEKAFYLDATREEVEAILKNAVDDAQKLWPADRKRPPFQHEQPKL